MGATYPHQAISGFKLLLRLLTIINQRKARAPTTTKVCLESKGNDAALVGLVDLGELFGQLVSGDRRSRRVKDVNDELTAGEEAVRCEFSGTNCDGGRGILRKESLCVSVHVRIVICSESIIIIIHPDALGTIQHFRTWFSPMSS